MSFFAGLASGIKQAQELKRDREKRQQQQKLIDAQLDLLKTQTSAAKSKLDAQSKKLALFDLLKAGGHGIPIGNVSSGGPLALPQATPQIPKTNPQTAGLSEQDITIGTAGGDYGKSDIIQNIAKAQTGNNLIESNALQKVDLSDNQTSPNTGSSFQANRQFQGNQNQDQFINTKYGPISKRFLTRMLLKETIGDDPGPLQARTIEGQSPQFKGRPVTQFYNQEGQKVGPEFPEFVEPDSTEFKTSEGTFRQGVDPVSGEKVGNRINTGPAETKLRTIFDRATGNVYEAEVNIQTGDEIEGTRKLKERAKFRFRSKINKEGQTVQYLERVDQPGVEIEGTREITKNADTTKAAQLANLRRSGPILKQMVGLIFEKDKKGNLTIPFLARAQGTVPDAAAKLGLPLATLAKSLAFQLLRPESGAAINWEELQSKMNQFLPKALTKVPFQEQQLIQMGQVIDDIFSQAQSDYVPVVEEGIRAELKAMKSSKGKGLKTPTPLKGKNEIIIDFEDL